MDKYDRQIRLWSKSGQKALSQAHILVVGVQTTTTEMIKCLALSGLSHITIYDPRTANDTDLTSNFFIQPSDKGQGIATAVASSLAELNPDITIDTVTSADNGEYDLVVVANGSTATLDTVYPQSDIVEVSSRGFYGRVRAFYRQFTSYETHPNSLVDLRFGRHTWPQLQDYLDSTDLNSLDTYARQQVPFTTILGKVSEVPSTLAEKRALKKRLQDQAGSNEDNWREAAQFAYHLWAPIIPSTYEPLFQKISLQSPQQLLTPFWSLVQALRDFVSVHDAPPLSGVLPDMSTSTENYTRLQQIYRKKAQQDAQEFSLLLSKYSEDLDEDTIRTFCKNSRHLLVIDGQTPSENTLLIRANNSDPSDPDDAKLMHFRDVFDALELAASKHQDFWLPDANSAAKIGELMQHPNQVVQNEIARSGGGELNSVASIIGGIAAQEVTKLILKHYTPLQHTLVYDGVSSSSAVF